MRNRTFVLGVGEVVWDAPVAAADDSGLRGDGFFETVLCRGPEPVRLSAHLDRFERSAAAFGVDVDRAAWTGLAHEAVGAVPAGDEAVLRLTLARDGVGLVTVRPVPAGVRAGRDGVGVVTLARGTTTVPDAPWLLTAAKTSSYAVNSAAAREAHRRGADDALLVDADGLVLEAPTANLLWRAGGAWCTPPHAGRTVLPGTTLAAVAAGLGVVEADVRPGELAGTDGAWLLSSVRGAAPVLRVDGARVPHDARLTEVLRGIALGTRREFPSGSGGATLGG
ncbi:aminotransferase class IV [Kineococcus rhizosphaerae]|uniref:4-amino-4-deoxychorismate lyase n=1 Tax=Kineococcus rhizosphaerae TaxID=559628 RepID=A0A2T0R808_9ACTN|nr:aminotransferase class IV [Kineococcus rhizosphaerae]PRY17282.1 4-amino-4-deoxychorismate lyase [Kineococcus rhizosphaerae]